MTQLTNRKIAWILVSLAVVRFAVVPVVFHPEEKTMTHTPVETTFTTNPFNTISIEAKAAYVFDLATGEVLFEKHSHAQLPLASLAKLMTALVAIENIPQNQIVPITSSSLSQEGSNGLRIDEKWKLRDLIDFTLLASSNDGANAIASVISAISGTDVVDIMNQKAASLNLEQTYFLNETGLDVSETSLSGSYGSARDVAIVLAHIVLTEPHILEATQKESATLVSLDTVAHEVDNTNTSVGALPWLLASKTGFTDLAGGNLAVAFDAGLMHPVIVVVLGSGVDGRFEDVEVLSRAVFDFLANGS